MKKVSIGLVCTAVALLAGCASVNSMWTQRYLFNISSSTSIQKMNKNDLYAVPNNDLCAAYNGTMSPIIKAEIQRRDLIINGNVWVDVNNGKTWQHMTLCQLLASQGKPNTVVKGETVVELDYDTTAYQVDNGVVTKISPIQPAK